MDALSTLSGLLYKEYGRRAILLIDEYDVPLAAASYRDRVNKVLYKNYMVTRNKSTSF